MSELVSELVSEGRTGPSYREASLLTSYREASLLIRSESFTYNTETSRIDCTQQDKPIHLYHVKNLAAIPYLKSGFSKQ